MAAVVVCTVSPKMTKIAKSIDQSIFKNLDTFQFFSSYRLLTIKQTKMKKK
jgi:hypothetical protein